MTTRYDFVEWNHDEVIDSGQHCIFCRSEMIRTRWVPGFWRHIDNGMVICVWAIKRGLWARRR